MRSPVWLLLAAVMPDTEAANATAATRQAPPCLSLPFVANRGQDDPAVAYSRRTTGGTLFVTRAGEIVYSLRGAGANKPGWTLVERLVGGRPRPVAGPRSATRVSRFVGADPRRWERDVPTYEAVTLGEVWPGVKMSLVGHADEVEKRFTLEPGASAARIRIAIDGARSVRCDVSGALVVGTGPGDVVLTAPVAYQENDGRRYAVAVAYEVHGRAYGFRLGAHDPRRPVVIDPLLRTTYLGGSGDDQLASVVVHPTSGDVLVVGTTTSADFPGTAGGPQPARAGTQDVVVARLDSALTTLLQATYVGGSGFERGSGLVVDPVTGDVVVAGITSSSDLPGTGGGAQPTSGGQADAFLARFNASLTALLQATYLGGSGGDLDPAITRDPASGDILAAGETFSIDLPGTAGGAQPNSSGNDGYVARLNGSLTTLEQTTYLGGGGFDTFTAVTIDAATGDVLVTGRTGSPDFPGTAGGADSTLEGFVDAVVARLDGSLTTLLGATFFGGNGLEWAQGVVAQPSGDVIVAGFTESTNLSGTAGGAQPTTGGGASDGFLVRFDAGLGTLVQATYLGGGGTEYIYGLAVDPPSGDVLVAGISW